jgi:hypothetical protein
MTGVAFGTPGTFYDVGKVILSPRQVNGRIATRQDRGRIAGGIARPAALPGAAACMERRV